jgi:PadR family transcriptional regulator, regulatory protein PadR
MPDMDANLKRGSAELAVLTVLVSRPLHGYEIARRIGEQSGGALRFDLASLYPLLYRMERDGWVKAKWEVSENGRRRRCYSLTREGRRNLAPLRARWRAFFQALDRLTGLGHA